MKKICPFQEKCYRKNPIHFDEMSHPHLEKLLNGKLNETITIPSNLDFDCPDEQQLLDQLKVLQMVLRKKNNAENHNVQMRQTATKRSPESSTSNSMESIPKKNKEETYQSTNDINKQSKSPSQQQGSSLFEKFSSSTTQSARMTVRNQAIENMKRAGHKIPHLAPIGEFNLKYALSSPYNIFLPCVEDSKETYNHNFSITFPEILDISLGEIIESLHINFMVDVGWLCLQYLFSGQKSDSLIVLGERADTSPIPSTMKIVTIKTPTNYGTHHSKISVLKYSNGGVRIIISTANLYMDDWENRTQALWMSPHLPKLPDDADKIQGETRTGFKHDFIDYMKQYKNSQLQNWIATFERLDFSSIDVFFVASVPGNFRGTDRDRWGLQRLRNILSNHAELPQNRSQWPVVAQASSIGSLGPNFDSWLTQDFIPAMASEKYRGIKSSPGFQLIYPSINNYKNSFDMRVGSCCLPYSMRTHVKQKWLEKYMYQWKSSEKYRDSAMPHSKIYTRISPDMKKISWMVLTSGNLSKAAWGYGKSTWTILNYEAGVVFFPQYLINSSTFPICNDNENNSPVILLPYDVPLTPYNSSDSPFVADFLQT
ncbi:hypothetical protein PV328_001414 [Microctonus aethiopoides]|nr:hypothetical protein PV328_001414 [Microctonus aethiopoides]